MVTSVIYVVYDSHYWFCVFTQTMAWHIVIIDLYNIQLQCNGGGSHNSQINSYPMTIKLAKLR